MQRILEISRLERVKQELAESAPERLLFRMKWSQICQIVREKFGQITRKLTIEGDVTLTGNCHCFLLAICHRIDRSSKFDRSKTENNSQSDNLRDDLE